MLHRASNTAPRSMMSSGLAGVNDSYGVFVIASRSVRRLDRGSEHLIEHVLTPLIMNLVIAYSMCLNIFRRCPDFMCSDDAH